MKSQNLLSDSFNFSDQEFHYRTCGCDSCRLNSGGSEQANNAHSSLTQGGGSLLTSGLISTTFSTHTTNALSASGGEILKYYIHNEIGLESFEDNSYGYSLGHTAEESKLIRSIFNRIDQYIDLDFHESSNWNGTVFDIYCVESYSEWDETTVGQVNDHGNGAGSYWDIYWKDTNGANPLNDNDTNTIVHEIGHALGLSHPYEDPWNGNWNTIDTIMSYNIGPQGWNTWFSDLDIAALIQIWGVEDDNGNGHNGTRSNDHLSGTDSSEIFAGLEGHDVIIAFRGADSIFGYEGNDELRAGNGRDYIWGGSGADELYGGFGHNTFGDERDGYQDWLYFKSDQFAWNWLDGKAGNNPTGQKVDIIKGLDTYDKIFIQGVETHELSFSQVNNFTAPLGDFTGIGIFANGYLEGIYTGRDLSTSQLQSMTAGVPGYQAPN